MQRTPFPLASPTSLPLSLKHLRPADALREACQLTAFLREFAFRLRLEEDDPALSADAAAGLEMALNLLQDKLDIGAGRYLFTLNGPADSPALAQRRDE